MNVIKIINPGLYTTIQDLGRFGFQQYGMPVSGAMDEFAFRIGNILAGNSQNTPAIEFTYTGLTVEFQNSAHIAITGGDFIVSTDKGEHIPCWSTLYIEGGTTLSISSILNGCRGYLCIYGGFDIPKVMGSASTYLRAKIGGLNGHLMKAGDEIPYLPQEGVPPSRLLPKAFIQKWYPSNSPIRVIMGPQDEAFTTEGIQNFLTGEYSVTKDADRMGYRLSGPPIAHKTGPDIISDGIAIGSIQVPGNGMPVIMLAERQTTGGYTKIATVITVDLPRLSQSIPGNILRFIPVSIEEGHTLLKEFYSDIDFIDSMTYKSNKKYYSIQVKNKTFKVIVEEI